MKDWIKKQFNEGLLEFIYRPIRKTFKFKEIKQKNKNFYWFYFFILFVSLNMLGMGLTKIVMAFKMPSIGLDVIVSDSKLFAVALFVSVVFIVGFFQWKAPKCIKRYGLWAVISFELLAAILILVVTGLLGYFLWVTSNFQPIFLLKHLAFWIPFSIAFYPILSRMIRLKVGVYIWVVIIIIIILPIAALFGDIFGWFINITSYNSYLSNSGDGVALTSFGLLLLEFSLRKANELLNT
ncbi:hypothetical protein FZC78_07660 [Rossellomorea vietnamensis]|uniref:Uncharacterized protein n=1 Tax=Rossellomorea vietnamensis TaxID=218284 RepID=A0A5D4NU50_9BACI|nr:hypothetical protein [Rossellomorea vietnamensis]TYS17727.1 hypothetical protein FZC78_07660 [Rossellomorea vietnamensis]